MEGAVDFFEFGIGDAGEGDAHRGVVGGAVGAAEIDGVLAEGFVQRVDGGVEARAGVFGFGGEEVAGVGGAFEEVAEHDADLERREPQMGAGAGGPEGVEHVREMERVLRLVEVAVLVPAGVVAVAYGYAQATGVVAGVPEAHGGFLEEAVEDGEGGLAGAAGGREDVAVADGVVLGQRALLQTAVHPGVKTRALDAAPDGAELRGVGGVELRDGGEAGGAEAGLHGFADAAEIREFEVEQFAWDVGVVDDDEAVGFFHVGGDFGEKPVRADADGAAQVGAGFAGDFGLDGERELAGAFRVGGEIGGEFAFEFVDGLHFFHGDAGADDGFEAAVVVDVNLGARFDDDEAGAEAAGLGDAGVALEAEFLGFAADGDEAGGLGEDGGDGDGSAAEFGAVLLFDGGEERVEVEGEVAERHGAGSVGEEKPLSNGVRWLQRGVFPMRIAVFSDTHDKYPPTLPARLAGADEIWHLGDVCDPAVLAEFERLGPPLHVVLGNCDEHFAWPLELGLEREGVKFFLTHIPPSDAPPGAKAVLHGHTHVPRDEVLGGVRWLNPGCISRPRGVAPTFAWLTVEKGKLVSWELVRV